MTAGRSMRHVGSVCLALMLSASGIDAAFGGIIANSPTGLASPTGVITFNLPVLAQDAQVTNQFSGVSFDPGTIYSFLQSTYAVLDGQYVGNFQDQGGNATFADTKVPFFMYFSSAVGGAAFQMLANASNWKFTALLGNNEVESFTANVLDQAYFGFTGIVFDRIKAEVVNDQAALDCCEVIGGVAHDFMFMDNLEFAAAPAMQPGNALPAPGSGLLLALGLTGMGLSARLRRRCGAPAMLHG